MADFALPHQQPSAASERPAVTGGSLYQRRQLSSNGPVELFPNPHFVFPRSPESPSDSTGHLSIPDPSAATPARSRGHAARPSATALPDFSFNPSHAASPPSATSTPPHSPALGVPTTPTSRSGGHRRGGSEFIGGTSKSGNVSLLSTSPTKTEGMQPPPPAPKILGPPAGRRGHAHRRSGAISSHDLTSMLQPANPAAGSRTESCPVSPIDRESTISPGRVEQPVSHSTPALVASGPSAEVATPSSGSAESSPQRPPSRARVGFSDRVEYIRPLSTISSETESSMSTLRGHSVSNSLSSVISAGTSSPNPLRMSPPSLSKTFDAGRSEPRPKTAGAVMGAASHSGSDAPRWPASMTRPTSAVSSGPTFDTRPTDRVIRKDFYPVDRRCGESGPPAMLSPDSVLSNTSTSSLDSPFEFHSAGGDRMDLDVKKSQHGKVHKKPRKVKSWANSIISRKAKPSQDKNKSTDHRPLTPPAPRPVEAHSAPPTCLPTETEFFENFDVDDAVTIVSDDGSTSSHRPAIPAWSPKPTTRQDSDTLSPEIDLDAALGPLNALAQGARGQGRGFSTARRTMHSSGFASFGTSMQLHRRAESAPELAPFDYSPGPLSTASTMADVFEEDEEEAEREFTNSGAISITSIPEEPAEEEAAESMMTHIGIQVVDTDDASPDGEMQLNFDGGLEITHGRRHSTSSDEASMGTLSREQTPTPTPIPVVQREAATPPKSDAIDVVEDFEEPRTAAQAAPLATPTEQKDPPTRPLRISLPLPHASLMTPDSTSSSFPSPDFPRGQNSFDTPRLGTASSSMTDSRPFHGAAFGEPGPDMRMSVDDVPSLTSSRSTMTSALQNTFPALRPRALGDRNSSLSSVHSADSVRRRKRSSIASLSKLMGGSFGERSKLHIEQRPQSEHGCEPPKQAKKSKAKRLSKLMHFWKSKDSLRS